MLDEIEAERGPRRRRLAEVACEMELRQKLRRHVAGYPDEFQMDACVPGVLFASAPFK